MSDRHLSKLNQAYSVIVAPAASSSRSLIPAAIFAHDTLYEPANAPPECRKSRQASKIGGRTPERQHGYSGDYPRYGVRDVDAHSAGEMAGQDLACYLG